MFISIFLKLILYIFQTIDNFEKLFYYFIFFKKI